MLQVFLILQCFFFFFLFQSCFDSFIFHFDFVLSKPFPLEKLKAFTYRPISTVLLTLPRRETAIMAGELSAEDSSRSLRQVKSYLEQEQNSQTSEMEAAQMLFLITSNLTFPPQIFAFQSLYLLPIIGLNLEIKLLFHLLTLLNFPFQSTAWDLLQLFQ